MEASSPYVFAIVGIIIGFIIGLGCYRLFSKGERNNASLRQTLLEREHQIAELKKGMGGHLTGVFEHLNSIRAQADQLEQKIVEDASQWHLGSSTPSALKEHKRPAQPESAKAASQDSQSSLATPRDYADGKNGTLSENFGLKENGAAPQPPRY